jgi:hypothetical protein
MTRLFLTGIAFLVVPAIPAGAPSSEPKLMPGQVVAVTPTPGDGVVTRTPVTVFLPRTTPYPKNSADEQLYLKGFSLGFLDSINGRFR